MDINKFVEILNVTIKKQMQHFIVNVMSKLFSKILQNNNKVLLQEIKKMISQSNSKQYDKDLSNVIRAKVDQSMYTKYANSLDDDIDFNQNQLNSILNNVQTVQQPTRSTASAKRMGLSQNVDTLQSGSVLDVNLDFLKNLKTL